jgi:molybdenum cofactor biosynthesis enzyme MoaA
MACLRQASRSLRRPMATVYELEPGGIRLTADQPELRKDLTPVLHRLVEPTGQSGHLVSQTLR